MLLSSLKHSIFVIFFMFSIQLSAQNSFLTLTSPSGGEIFQEGKRIQITWTSINIDQISIQYSEDDGLTWKSVTSSIRSIPQSFTWQIPSLKSAEINFRIANSNDISIISTSEKVFIQLNNEKKVNVVKQKIQQLHKQSSGSKLNIMPLGNSITRGIAGSSFNVGYRRLLYQNLTNFDYSIDFVGTQIDGIYTDFDMDHEGHGGWHAEHPNNSSLSIVDSISNWLDINNPDIILLHIGTNDITEFELRNENADDLVGEVNSILDSIEVYETNRGVSIPIFLAQIINRVDNLSTTSIDESLVTTEFNDALKTSVNLRKVLGDEIILVDFENELQYPDDLSDGVHPNDDGYVKMANLWFNELVSYLGDPPSIVTQPSSEGVFEGEIIEYKVNAVGKLPITYQWKKNGINIPGAVDSAYLISPATLEDNETQYNCTVSNSLGSINTKSVYLYVTPQSSRVSGGQLVYYNFDEGGSDTIYDIAGYPPSLDLIIEDTSAVSWTHYGLNIDSPVNINSTEIASKIFNSCVESNEISIEAWVKPSNLTQTDSARIITYSPSTMSRNFTLGQVEDSYQVGFRTSNTSNTGLSLNSGSNSANLELTQIVFTRSNTGSAKIFINGIEKINDTVNYLGNLSNWDATYGITLANEVSGDRPFEGLFYLISVYDRQLGESEILHNYSVSKPVLQNPSNLSIEIDVNKNIILDWDDNSTNELGFIIERSISDTLSFEIIDTLSPNLNSIIDTNTLEGLNHFYRVKAFNDIVESNYSEVAKTVIPLNAPTNLDVSFNSSDFPELNWEDNSNNEIGFIIEGKAAHVDSLFYSIDTLISNSVSYVDTIPKFFTPFVYRLYAITQDTVSDYSNEFEANVVVNISKSKTNLPSKFRLYQNYPNPFNPSTKINFDLPKKSKVKITIFNTIGQLITVLTNQNMSAGHHNLEFNAKNYPSGIYYCSIQIKSSIDEFYFQDVIKLLLLK